MGPAGQPPQQPVSSSSLKDCLKGKVEGLRGRGLCPWFPTTCNSSPRGSDTSGLQDTCLCVDTPIHSTLFHPVSSFLELGKKKALFLIVSSMEIGGQQP